MGVEESAPTYTMIVNNQLSTNQIKNMQYARPNRDIFNLKSDK